MAQFFKFIFSWSFMFLLVPILGVGVFAAAIFEIGPFYGHWFPEDISEHGAVIDGLFNSIMFLTGVIFIGTGIALFYFMWKYDAAKNTEPVKFTHGSHSLEICWSIIPAVTLLFIAVYQMHAWADAKMIRPKMEDGSLVPPIAEVTGRQFEWRIKYAGADGEIGTEDDIHVVNDLHLPEGEEIVLAVKSEDVLHSFFLPNVRLKHDLVPGMKQYVWFKLMKRGQFDIVCAELCGWGHYKMKGRLTVQSRPDFERWLEETRQAQNWPSSPEDLETSDE